MPFAKIFENTVAIFLKENSVRERKNKIITSDDSSPLRIEERNNYSRSKSLIISHGKNQNDFSLILEIVIERARATRIIALITSGDRIKPCHHIFRQTKLCNDTKVTADVKV